MRAVEPVTSAHVERDGFRVHYEVYGAGESTVFLLMPNVIVHARAWKAQIPFLARRFRVITIDPRGNGGSDTPTDPDQVTQGQMMEDAWAVLDEVGAEDAVLVGLCSGAGMAVVMAAERPERVRGVFAINPGLDLTEPLAHKTRYGFNDVLDTDAGWAKLNRHYWQRDWPGFARFFFEQLFPEPHSTKQVDDGVEWALSTTVETMLLDADSQADPRIAPPRAEELARSVRCPMLVLTGAMDHCQNPERSRRLVELTGAEHVVIEGGGHLPNARDPVYVNLLLADFVRRVSR